MSRLWAAVDSTVETVNRKVRGRSVAGIHSFLGVRYGASTEGRGRFRPPQKPRASLTATVRRNAILRQAAPEPTGWSVAVLSGLAGMGSLSANFFVPSAAQALFHLDPVHSSYLISTGFTLAIFVNLLFGFLMDRFPR